MTRTARGVAVLLGGVAVAMAVAVVTLSQAGLTAPGLRLAFFPPTWGDIQIFRAIILGDAKPISSTVIPGAWLIHLDPGQPARIQGAIVTGAGPFTRFATAACLVPSDRR